MFHLKPLLCKRLLRLLHCIQICLILRELFRLFILDSCVSCHSGRREGDSSKHARANGNRKAARKYSVQEIAASVYYFFHLSCGFYLMAASIRENTITLFFLYEAVKLDPRLAALKVFMIFRVYCSYFFLFFPIF